jgi:hypothetical protein
MHSGEKVMGRLVFSVVLLSAAACTVRADTFVPDGVPPGGSYHLAFVTNGLTNGISTDVNTYDGFVNGQARQVGAVTEDIDVYWRAMISGSGETARDRTAIQAPVYLVNGTMIATGFDDMWDGALLAFLDIDQFGNQVQVSGDPHRFNHIVITGSNSAG